MATTLAQQYTRSGDSVFRNQVEAAFWKIMPDINREAVGNSINDGNTPVTLTQPQVDKRRAWAADFIRQPAYWVPKCASMLAGEQAILLIDLVSVVDDATVEARARRCVHALAGA